MTETIVGIIKIPFLNEQTEYKDYKIYSIPITTEENKTPDQLLIEETLNCVKKQKLDFSDEFDYDYLEFDFKITADELDNYHQYNKKDEYPSFHEFCKNKIEKINPNFFENNDIEYFKKINTFKFSNLYSFQYYDKDREIYQKEKDSYI
jgi:hypothetical protein